MLVCFYVLITMIMGNSLSYEIRTFTGTSFDSMICITPNTERTPLWMYAKSLCFAGSFCEFDREIIFQFEVLSFNSHIPIHVLGLLKWILQPEKSTKITSSLCHFPQWCCWGYTYNKAGYRKRGSIGLTPCSFIIELVMLVLGSNFISSNYFS